MCDITPKVAGPKMGVISRMNCIYINIEIVMILISLYIYIIFHELINLKHKYIIKNGY